MPDKKRKAKRRKWLSERCWLELFGESITEVPDNAERIMVLMISLQQMIDGDKSDRKAARRAIWNCARACAPYTTTQILAEDTAWKVTKHGKNR